MKPNILNPQWRYIPAVRTDVRRTFARERARLKAEAEKQSANEAERLAKVAVMKRGAA